GQPNHGHMPLHSIHVDECSPASMEKRAFSVVWFNKQLISKSQNPGSGKSIGVALISLFVAAAFVATARMVSPCPLRGLACTVTGTSAIGLPVVESCSSTLTSIGPARRGSGDTKTETRLSPS